MTRICSVESQVWDVFTLFDPGSEEFVNNGQQGGGREVSSFIHTWQTNPSITAVVLSNYCGYQDVKLERK
ncbi:MAG: hypothetical protein NTZ52_03700 [Chlamydiae bacterium]|nr:hypothetical protein [Chlamydiota bacterium]